MTQASERSEARLGGCHGGYTGCVRAGPGSPATSKGTSEPKRPLQNAAPRGQSSVAGLQTPPRQRAPGPGFSRRGAESRVRRSHLPRGSLSPATPAIAADEKLGQGMDSPGRGLSRVGGGHRPRPAPNVDSQLRVHYGCPWPQGGGRATLFVALEGQAANRPSAHGPPGAVLAVRPAAGKDAGSHSPTGRPRPLAKGLFLVSCRRTQFPLCLSLWSWCHAGSQPR